MPAGRPRTPDSALLAALPATAAFVARTNGLRDVAHVARRLRAIPGVTEDLGIFYATAPESSDVATVLVPVPLSALRDAMEGRR